MIKNNKKKLFLSSLAIFLPSLIGLILWNDLPDMMNTHWGADGNVDGFAPKAMIVFGLPFILLAFQWLCILITVKDPKNKDQNRKVFGLVLWIIPIISVFACGIIYAVALGKSLNLSTLLFSFLGLIFVVVGNYLPKCKQNHTIGIKITWTLANEENWNATHRFGGKVWVIGGLLLMIAGFIPESLAIAALFLAITVLVLIPFLYSYLYYQKQVKAGTAPKKAVVPAKKLGKTASVLTSVSLVLILALVIVVLFTGNIRVQYDETSFTVRASYWNDLTVEYSAVDSVEYREEYDAGSRVSGFGSPRLSMGLFRNSEFNTYTLYSYTQCDSCVVLKADKKILVISGTDAESTKAIYEELLLRTGL